MTGDGDTDDRGLRRYGADCARRTDLRALVSVVGIGMADLPAGILASGLAALLRRRRAALTNGLIPSKSMHKLKGLSNFSPPVN